MTENEPFIFKSHRFEVNNMKGSDTYVILTSEYLAGDRVQRYDETNAGISVAVIKDAFKLSFSIKTFTYLH